MMRVWHLGTQSLWADECLTAVSVRSLGDVVENLRQVEVLPPLYFIVEWGWAHIFGFGEVGLRSLSAVAGTATIPLAFLAVREVASRRAALLTATFVAINPMLVWFSQE